MMIPSVRVLWRVDEEALADSVRRAFVKQFSEAQLSSLKVKRHPGDEFFIILEVPQKTDEIQAFCREVSDDLIDQGLHASVLCRETKT